MSTTVILKRGLPPFSLPPARPVSGSQDAGIPGAARARLRAYRQALRVAELAVWNAADPKAITRLPAPLRQRERAESIDFLLLVVLVAALILVATFTPEGSTQIEAMLRSLRSMLP